MTKATKKPTRAKYPLEEFLVQRLPDRYLFLRRSREDGPAAGLMCVAEVPLKAPDSAFARAIEQALHPLTGKQARSLVARTRKLPYFRDIQDPEPHNWRLKNTLARQGASVRFKVAIYGTWHPDLADHDRLEISASWKGEIAHREDLPPDTDPKTVAKHLRQAFELASEHPRHRFRFNTRIWVYRLDDQYFFEDLCLVDGDLEVHDLHQLPSKTGDRELGQALLDALTRLPRVTLKEHINHERRELPGEAIIRSTRAYLFWDGIESPGRLSFAIVRPDASREAAITVSVNATAATVGKLVRSAFAKKMGRALRGLPHEELYQRLDRADFFEFCRRKATARSAFLKNGWQAAILEDVGRSFIADAEDLAEGGVGSLLRDMKPFFKSIGLETGRTRDDSREESYDVWLGDRCYPILVKDDFRKAAKGLANLWGMAGFRTATLLNFLLRKHGRKEQACSVSGGNEHWFLLITPEQHALLKRGRGYDKSSGPYHATGDAPNYGMIEY